MGGAAVNVLTSNRCVLFYSLFSFQEPGALPFSPRRIRSQFQHVFIVVRAVDPCSDNTQYRVAVSRSKEVPIFGPPVPQGAIFTKGKTFADFILAKVINAENAAHRYSISYPSICMKRYTEYIYQPRSVVDRKSSQPWQPGRGRNT